MLGLTHTYTQVTIEYDEVNGQTIPKRVSTLLISTQHAETVDGKPEGKPLSNEQIRAELVEHVVKTVIPANMMDDTTVMHLNPSGRFVIGGPQVCGVCAHVCLSSARDIELQEISPQNTSCGMARALHATCHAVYSTRCYLHVFKCLT
jgi:hypothetical protein